MSKRLDAWGMVVATLLGTALLGCADAHARPADYPESAHLAGNLPANSVGNGGDFEELESLGPDGEAIESSSAELHDVDVAIEASGYAIASDDYDLALDQDPSAIDEFQDVLAPYGEWTEDATYGTVWVPDTAVVGSDFAPYVTAGHWALTESDEWLWVSDYDWGWAPFHYGRWVWIGGRGWAWIPGRVYAPAWVVWRTGYYDDYYVGWAPMPPTWYWRGGIAVSVWAVPPAPYVFCSTRYIFTPHIRTHVVPAARVGVIARHTRSYYAATPTGRRGYASYVRGPSPREIRVPARAAPRATHHPRAIERAKPVPGGRISAVARPRHPSRPIGQSHTLPAPSRATKPSGTGRPLPAAPRPHAPRSVTPMPRAPSATPAPRPQPARPPTYTPAPSVSPRTPAPRPSPAPSPTPRVSPAPRTSPSLQPSPSPRVAPVRPAPAPRATVRPSGSGGHLRANPVQGGGRR